MGSPSSQSHGSVAKPLSDQSRCFSQAGDLLQQLVPPLAHYNHPMGASGCLLAVFTVIFSVVEVAEQVAGSLAWGGG